MLTGGTILFCYRGRSPAGKVSVRDSPKLIIHFSHSFPSLVRSMIHSHKPLRGSYYSFMSHILCDQCFLSALFYSLSVRSYPPPATPFTFPCVFRRQAHVKPIEGFGNTCMDQLIPRLCSPFVLVYDRYPMNLLIHLWYSLPILCVPQRDSCD